MHASADMPGSKGQGGLLRAALFGECPQCGARSLFALPAAIAPQCRFCGLDLAALDRGARFVALPTLIVTALLIAGTLGLDAWLRPPLLLLALLLPPITIGAVLYALRLFKTAFVYRHYEISLARGAVAKDSSE